MTERKPNTDNALIAELEAEGGAASQSGSAGGDLQRDVGTRSEMHDTAGEPRSERPHAQDNPEAMNESKGDKTIARLQPGDGNEGGGG
jgi:hypothetical protein